MSDVEKDNLKRLRDDEKYIKELLEGIKSDQRKKWIAHNLYTYAERAHWYKRLYWICYFYCVGMPVFTAALQLGQGRVIKIVIVFLMGSITAVAGMTNGMKLREKWEHYRKYCEATKREISCCLNRIGDYEGEENLEEKLGQRIARLFQEETNEWHKIKPNFPNSSLKQAEETLITHKETHKEE